jgi:hypothetical protein
MAVQSSINKRLFVEKTVRREAGFDFYLIARMLADLAKFLLGADIRRCAAFHVQRLGAGEVSECRV